MNNNETLYFLIIQWLYLNDGNYHDKNEWRVQFLAFLTKTLELPINEQSKPN